MPAAITFEPEAQAAAINFEPEPPANRVANAPLPPVDFQPESGPVVDPARQRSFTVTDNAHPGGPGPESQPDLLSRTVDDVNNSSNNPFDWLRSSGNLAKSFLTDVFAGHVQPSPSRVLPDFPNVSEYWQGREPSEFKQLPTVAKGVAETGAALPQIGVGTLLTWAGVPAPLAFAGVMGGQTFSDRSDLPMSQRVTEATKSGAVGAVMPGASEFGAKVGGDALVKLVGKTGASDATMAAAEVLGKTAGSQSMLNALMVSAQSPELLEQAQSDPAAFRESLIKIVAGNMSFEVPQLAGHLREVQAAGLVDQYMQSPEYRAKVDDVATHLLSPQSAQWFSKNGIGVKPDLQPGTKNAPFVGKTKIDFVPESGTVAATTTTETSNAGAQATIDGSGAGRVESASPAPIPEQRPVATVGDLIGQKLDELKAILNQHNATGETPLETPVVTAPKTITDDFVEQLRAGARAVDKGDAQDKTAGAPEGGPGTITGPSETVDERTGSEMPAESQPVQPETAASENSDQTPPSGAPSSTTPTAARKQGRRIAAGIDRPWDVLELIGKNYLNGSLSLASFREIDSEFKPLGPARKLFSRHGTVKADVVADNLRRSGMLKPDAETDDLLEAINGVGPLRQAHREQKTRENRAVQEMVEQSSAWEHAQSKPNKGMEKLVPDDLQEGEVFTVKGARVRVAKLNFDEKTGEVESVDLEDGSKFGHQTVPGDEALRVDKGSYVPKARADGSGNAPFSLAPGMMGRKGIFEDLKRLKDNPNFQKWFGGSKVVDDLGKPKAVYHGTSSDFTSFDKTSLGRETNAQSAKRAFFFSDDHEVAGSYAGLNGNPRARAIERGMKNATRRLSELENDIVNKYVKDQPPAPTYQWKPLYDAGREYYKSIENSDPRVLAIKEELFDLRRRAAAMAYENRDLKTARDFRDHEEEGSNIIPAYLQMRNPHVVDMAGGSFESHPLTPEIRYAQENGHDGVIFKNLRDAATIKADKPSTIYAVFEPTQIKSAIGNRGTFDPHNPDIRYSKGADTNNSRVTRADVEGAVTPLSEKMNGVRVKVVQSESELPNHLQRQIRSQGAEGRAEGVFDPVTGKVHLIADNLDSAQRAREVFAHEAIGHLGIRKLMGGHFNSFMDGVFAGHWQGDLMKSVVEDYGFDLKNLEDRRAAAEEVVARLAEKPDLNPTLWQRVVAQVRQWLRQAGFGDKVSENDIRAMLAKAKRGLEQDFKAESESSHRLSLRKKDVAEVGSRPFVPIDDAGDVDYSKMTLENMRSHQSKVGRLLEGATSDAEARKLAQEHDRAGMEIQHRLDVVNGKARFSFRELEQEGDSDRPKWLSKEDGNEVWKMARDLVNAGDTPDHAIRVALSHLQSMGNKNFNMDDARRFAASMKPTLEGMKGDKVNEPIDQTNANDALPVSSSSSSPEAEKMDKPSWQPLKDDLDKRHDEFVKAIRDYGTPRRGKNPGSTPDEIVQTDEGEFPLGKKRVEVSAKTKAERLQVKNVAAARYREAQRNLRSNPDFIADLILSQHRLGEKISAAGKGEASRELISAGEEIQNELSKCPQNIVAGVYEKMQQDGRLPRGNEIPQASRSLSTLVDWLRGQDVDSPKKSLKERFGLARLFKDRVARPAGDAVSRGWTGAQSAWKTFVESYKSPPTDTDFRRTIKDWSLAEETVGHETRQWEDEINEKVPNPSRRKAISHYLFAKGDQSLLDHWATSVPERYRSEFEAARNLTDSEKAIAEKVKQEFDQKLLDATLGGMLDKGRDNYGVPMLWSVPPKDIGHGDAVDIGDKKTAGNWRAKLDPRDPFFALQRSHDSYFDGIMAGGVPLTTDVGKLVAVYNRAFSKNLSSRAVIWALKDAKAADGLPVVKISGSAKIVPQGNGRAYLVDSKSRSASDMTVDGRPYMAVDHWALRNWKFVANTIEGAIDPETGKPFPPGKVLVHGEMLVHPDHYAFLKNELQQPWRDPKTNELTGLGKVFVPALKTKVFLTASKFALGTFHMFTLGEHVIFHGVNPFMNGFRIDLREPEQASAVRNGLLLGFDREQTQFDEGLASHGGLWAKVPGLGDSMAKLSGFVFRTYLPTMKMKLWQTVNERNMKRYGPESKADRKLTPDEVAELSAQQVNAALGGQNWRLLGRDKHLVDLSRLALAAPDFLISRAKVVGQAMKPYGREQQRFLVTQAALLYIGARVMNQLLDDDPHWGWDHAFSVIHNGREYSVRTIVGDMHHMMTSPDSFLAGRLSAWTKTGIETSTGRDLRTGTKIRTITDLPGLRQAEIAVRSLAEWLSPIGSEGMLPGKAKREQTALSTLAQATVGLGSRKYTAQSKTYELADQFNRKQPDARSQNYVSEHESRVGTESVYRALNDYLEAGKLDDARKEYQSLLKDGHKPETIARHYESLENRPFTGDATREDKFKRLMTPEQKTVYERAKAERRQLNAEFLKIKG